MEVKTRLRALLATMERINPALFGQVCPSGATSSTLGLRIGGLNESVLRACAWRTPELTAGVVAVHLLATAATAAADGQDSAISLFAEDVEGWCANLVGFPFPWPTRLPVPDWARSSGSDPWREADMFYSAAATTAGLAVAVPSNSTRTTLEQLAERLLHRAEGRAALATDRQQPANAAA